MGSESHHCDVRSSQVIEILIKAKGKEYCFSNLGYLRGGRLWTRDPGPKEKTQELWEGVTKEVKDNDRKCVASQDLVALGFVYHRKPCSKDKCMF